MPQPTGWNGFVGSPRSRQQSVQSLPAVDDQLTPIVSPRLSRASISGPVTRSQTLPTQSSSEMSTFKLGKLQASIFLDEPERLHFGTNETIRGKVVLNYLPYTSIFKKKTTGTATLFGPMKMEVVLSGAVSIRIRRDREIPTQHGATLFTYPFLIHDGTFKAEAGESYSFPYAIKINEIVEATELESIENLPPSFVMHFSDYPDMIECVVRYQLGVRVELPGIDIKTLLPMERRPGESLGVKYELARSTYDLIESGASTYSEGAVVQNEYLLPINDRPSGFKARAKAVFTNSHFPRFALNIFCTEHRYVFPGMRMHFEVVARRDDSESGVQHIPEIFLESFKIYLIGKTTVDSSLRFIGRSQCSDKRTLQCMEPVSGAMPVELFKGNDYTTTVILAAVMGHTSSFEHPKLSRTYTLKTVMRFTVAQKTVKITHESPVILVPPPLDDAEGELVPAYDYEIEVPRYERQASIVEATVEAGPSQPNGRFLPDTTEEEEQEEGGHLPPSYEEVQAGAGPSSRADEEVQTVTGSSESANRRTSGEV